jgi:hypothetical protein
MNFLCLTQSQDAMFGMVASAIQMIRAGKTAYAVCFIFFKVYLSLGLWTGRRAKSLEALAQKTWDYGSTLS